MGSEYSSDKDSIVFRFNADRRRYFATYGDTLDSACAPNIPKVQLPGSGWRCPVGTLEQLGLGREVRRQIFAQVGKNVEVRIR